MQEFVKLTGIVLKTVPIGDYDRRVVILTKERGKISAFAKGARKPNSRLVAAASPFAFGEFKLYEGRSSYNIMEADIRNYFEALRDDFAAACYGMYFLETADYYTRENADVDWDAETFVPILKGAYGTKPGKGTGTLYI